MKTLLSLIITLILLTANSNAEALNADAIRQLIKKSANWHIANPFCDEESGWRIAKDYLGVREWHMAPYYDGLLRLSQVTGDSQYLAYVMSQANRVGWTLGDLKYHADDHAVGHAWLDIYQMDPRHTERLNRVKERFDYVIANPQEHFYAYGKPMPHGVSTEERSNRWTWCDALYMAPPTLARLWKATGDEKYMQFMMNEYHITYEHLWSPDDKLFFRDGRFITQRTQNGRKIFWSRGNGWVYAGLPLILECLPKDQPNRPFFEKLFLEMTQGIVAAQQDNGMWFPNLGDPDHVSISESSGTAFFIFGLTWGINNGYLDKAVYWPKIEKAWNALTQRVQPNGKVGYVQPVGAEPEYRIHKDSTQVYGAGGLFLAGSELLKSLNADSKVDSSQLLAEAQTLLDGNRWLKVSDAYYIPERKDDVAWENDKVAFRVYGPALRDSTEDSGVDVWMKRVPYPVVANWYEKELSGNGSYHEDTGEGYDGYKVGAARGCGGSGIWYEGKLYTSDTYERVNVGTTPDGLSFVELYYHYKINGEVILERKLITLRAGSYLSEVLSEFHGNSDILKDMEFVVGLSQQTPTASIQHDGPTLTMWDTIDGYWLASAVQFSADIDARTINLRTIDSGMKKEFLLTAKPLDHRINYRFGYAWERFSPFETHDRWHRHVENTLHL